MARERRGGVHVRSGAAEFLTFAYQRGGDGVEVRVGGGTVWLSRQAIGELFGTSPDNAGLHLKSIYAEGELDWAATAEEFSVVRQEGGRDVRRTVRHYSLDAIIAVGYRVNSRRATAFRQWATGVLRDYALRGYALDRKRMENGAFLGEDYFELLLEEIREIRLSERHFYQKITDIYATAADYDGRSPTTKEFFAKVQNKMHFAVHGRTAAELVHERADAGRERGRILKSDVGIAKNYLTESELQSLGRLVGAYLDLAERRAMGRTPMTMEGWAKHLDLVLQADGNELLADAGKISARIAKEHAECEFEKFRAAQDRLFESDFDRHMKEIERRAFPVPEAE
jgi:hypothetical protein